MPTQLLRRAGDWLRDASDHHSALVKLAVRQPSLVGAVVPSSPWLSKSMARAADGAAGLIELGAGTGAITATLLARHPELPLTVVELQPQLASVLRQRFPRAHVVCRSADEVLAGFDPQARDITVVSSLPFRSLPSPIRHRCINAIADFLLAAPGRRLVQFTYQPRAPFPLTAHKSLQWQRIELVWRNAPPAGVWILKPTQDQDQVNN